MTAFDHAGNSRQDPPARAHIVRGVLVSIVLGPPLVLGALLAATGLVSSFIAAWSPASWFSSNVADWAFGTGVRGDAANYLRFMVGAVIASASWAGIRIAFGAKG